MMDFWLQKFRGLMLAPCVLGLASCAISKPVPPTEGDRVDTASESTPAELEPVPEMQVGTVAMVKSSGRGRGFVLVRPVSKRTRVDVGETLEARDNSGLKTATMMRSAEDNRRFFVADIRDGMPSEGDRVIVLAKKPKLLKSPSGLLQDDDEIEMPDDIDLTAPLSLPPMDDGDIEAMEP